LPPEFDNPANSSTADAECFSEVFLEAGNGNADIADIALQQLTETAVQDS
jgi:hypothetical protein